MYVLTRSLSHVQLLSTRQAPLSMGLYRQEYWSWLSFPPPGDLPNPEIEPTSPVSPALAGVFFITAPPGSNLRQDSDQCRLPEKDPDNCYLFLMTTVTKYQKLKPEWFKTTENSCLSLLEGGLVAESCPTLGTPWTVACQVPPSMGFSR